MHTDYSNIINQNINYIRQSFKKTLYLVYLLCYIEATIYRGLLSIFTENSVKLAYRMRWNSNYFVFLWHSSHWHLSLMLLNAFPQYFFRWRMLHPSIWRPTGVCLVIERRRQRARCVASSVAFHIVILGSRRYHVYFFSHFILFTQHKILFTRYKI